MKKAFTSILLLLVLVISACGNNAANVQNETPSASPSNQATNAGNSNGNDGGAGNAANSGTITYQSENGPIDIPANPQRIIALTNAPNVISLGGTLVGVDEWTKKNPLFTEKLEGIETVSEADLEKLIELEPDLIIAGSHMQNLDKIGEIAPTIVYTWGKLDYLAQQLEIGKVLNKEAEAQAWIDDFTARAKAAGEEIKAKIGENATVSVFEYDTKDFYVFGNNWARGTEVLYQAMGLGMNEKVKQDALGPGYYTLSNEVIADYAGDYIVLSRVNGSNNAFLESETWKNIPAVKNNRVIELDTESISYSDPTTLEYLLDIFKKEFLAMP
ncbi:iron-hydroxamate ABC transporter substrate-binding protein [Paenibacillus nanensis]|uniref:Iron-hydroxamate ABC transporter substrate-binding protein n=1 Tax=Paenibacillus nanensis TaxID=393251 RepID=A0A3A1V953_9BACL|nr:iron-hydroxamate ABC transporter substrate-binding protein [Paenibacillus nanensis]RIX53950.1 iron-hydroxamate ABC transporter substrate-binding protein [Paenibacillus nanensis]